MYVFMGYGLFCCSNHSLILLPTDQLNTTVHGVMKTTPYELVFGQPPRQNIFPGVVKTRILEEDIEDLLSEEDTDGDSQDKEKSENPSTRESPNDEDTGDKSQGEDKGRGENQDRSKDDQGPDDQDRSKDDQGPDDQDRSKDDQGPDDQHRSEDDQDNKADLATTDKHRQLREAADKQYRQNAERMKLKYCKAKRKKVLTFSKGDFVSVKIPRIDRSSTDFHRLPCVVVEKLGSEFHLYRLRYITT